jgi:hypothetical protein
MDDNIKIDFRSNDVSKILEQLLEMSKEGTIDRIVFAAFDKNNEVVIGKANINSLDQQHLVSYLQVDTTKRIIKEGM